MLSKLLNDDLIIRQFILYIIRTQTGINNVSNNIFNHLLIKKNRHYSGMVFATQIMRRSISIERGEIF